ncbi:MAG: hypothetical protein IKE91_05690 [Clostridia bacterium]|nr:hypothetical protein [Clostridia bacterium]
MILNLYWSDNEKNSYNIASLEKKENIYELSINEPELKKATHHGCFGIGEIKFLQDKYVSEKLFPFFSNRIPSINNPRINVILDKYKLEKYDEMELLKVTEARLSTDRYFCKEKVM